MSQREQTKTRREFLKAAGKVAAGASLGGMGACFPDVGGTWPKLTEACVAHDTASLVEGPSEVVEVLCEASAPTPPTPFQIDEERVRAMLEAALGALGGGTAAKLWERILPDYSPAMRIGIKVNCLNPSCPTSVPVVKALVGMLKSTLGISEQRLLVWDRRLDELRSCGFTEEAVGAPVMGTINSTTDGSGPGYGEAFCGVVAGKAPRLSRILTELTDVTLNVPVLKSHDVSGITAAFKNIYGIIDRPEVYHTSLATALPALYCLPPIRTRMRLHIVDAIRAVTRGGTSDVSDRVPKRLLVSADPVALDNYALALVNDLRAHDPLRPLGPVNEERTGWLKNAYDLGLGSLESRVANVTL